jgi:hypothetical protein
VDRGGHIGRYLNGASVNNAADVSRRPYSGAVVCQRE